MPRAGISIDDPHAADVRELLARHLEFARSHTPPEGAYALGAEEPGEHLHDAGTAAPPRNLTARPAMTA